MPGRASASEENKNEKRGRWCLGLCRWCLCGAAQPNSPGEPGSTGGKSHGKAAQARVYSKNIFPW